MQSTTHGLRRYARRATELLLLATLGGAMVSATAYAQQREGGGRLQQRSLADEAEDASSAGTVDANVGNVINQAYDAIQAENYALAKDKLGTLRVDRLSPYERSQVENLYFVIAYEAGDYPTARQHLQNMIDSGGLNEQQTSQVRFQLAQLFLAEEKWAEAAAAFEEWFKTAVNPNSNAYYMLAAAYFQMNDFDRALAPAEKAVELMTTPDPNWIQLLLAIYSERKEFAKALPLLKRLIVLQPQDKRWWVSLSMHHSLLEDQQSALAVMELANHLGLLTEQDEIMRMAELADYNDLPYRCAKIISEGIASRKLQATEKLYERNANCWLRAREMEEAIPPLVRAAEMAENGDRFITLAEVQTQRRNWEGVIEATDKALEKGKLTDTARASLLKGVALFNLDRKREARASLEAAARSEKYRNQVRPYLESIDAEQR